MNKCLDVYSSDTPDMHYAATTISAESKRDNTWLDSFFIFPSIHQLITLQLLVLLFNRSNIYDSNIIMFI